MIYRLLKLLLLVPLFILAVLSMVAAPISYIITGKFYTFMTYTVDLIDEIYIKV